MSQHTNAAMAADSGDDVDNLEDFLAGVERRALRMAQVSAGDREAALDIVQDAMLKLVQHYRDRAPAEWRPLFYRILHNRINDWHRSQRSRWQVFERWFGGEAEEGQGDALDRLGGDERDQPDRQLLSQLTLEGIERALSTLSPRQQQAFMLRCWEGLSTSDTALAMECTEGTVKTLYSRSLTALKQQLGDHYGQ